MKLKVIALLTLIICLVLGNSLVKNLPNAKTKTYKIGIIQTAPHPALDAARDGFISTIETLLNQDIEFIIHNAQGSVANAHTIAQQLHNDQSFDAFFALATTATQALAHVEKNRPIVIAAVTDPHALGLIHPKTNICGSIDMIDVQKQIQDLQKLLPEAQNIAIIFNPSEINSIQMNTLIKKELTKLHKNIFEIGIHSHADIPTALASGLLNIDAVIAPTDNLVASAITFIASETKKRNIPLIVSDNLLVSEGALMARGVDYNKCGQQAAELAYKVLTCDKKPYELPLTLPNTQKIFVNMDMLNHYNLEIPENLKHEIVTVQGK